MSEIVHLNYEEARAQLTKIDELVNSPAWRFFVDHILAARLEHFDAMLKSMQVNSLESVAYYNKVQGRATELSDLPAIMEGIRNELYEEVKKLQDQLEEGTDNA